MFARSGTIVCVWEPQSVWTPLMQNRARRVGQVEDADPLEAERRAAGGRVADERTSLQKSLPSPFRLRRVDRLEEQEAPVVLPEPDVVLRPAAELSREQLLRLQC